jgi:hypothetical protein
MKTKTKHLAALILTVACGLWTLDCHAQTFGGGITVTGNTNGLMQSVPGTVVTNTAYLNIPAKTLLLSQITSTNETAIGYYGFQIPANYPLMPGTTNVYVVASFTNSFALPGGTNNGTLTTNFAGIYNLPIPLVTVMGLSIGANTNVAYVP